MIVDTHCHLDLFDDVEKVTKDIIAVTAGVDHETNLKSLELSKKFNNVKCCLGLYPLEVLKLSDLEIDKEISFIKQNKNRIVGIGEIGLDFKEGENKRQVRILTKIVNELRSLDKIFVVHSRKAEKECVELFEKLKIKKVLFPSLQERRACPSIAPFSFLLLFPPLEKEGEGGFCLFFSF